MRLGAVQPKGLRASRRGSKAALGSRETLIELPDGSHQLINSDPGMQIIVIKSNRGYQPIQIPLVIYQHQPRIVIFIYLVIAVAATH